MIIVHISGAHILFQKVCRRGNAIMLMAIVKQMEGSAKSTVVNKIKQDFLEIKQQQQQNFGHCQVFTRECTIILGK